MSGPTPLFLDSGAVDLFVDPPDQGVIRFWSRFGAETPHYISHVVYWEFLRQYSPRGYAIGRKRFLRLLDSGGLRLVGYDRHAADYSVLIYQALKKALSGASDAKQRLRGLHCDIIIASTAVAHHCTVATQDLKDWALIREVVTDLGIGILPLLDRKDMS